MKSLLLLVHSDRALDSRFQVALDVVRAVKGHLTCLDVTVYPAMAMDNGDSFTVLYIDECAREVRNQTGLEPRLVAAGVSWDWINTKGPLDSSLINASGLNDLIIVSSLLEANSFPDMKKLVGDLLMRGNKPILAAPGSVATLNVSGHAVIAWDGSDAAVDALRASVPLLRLANVVTILEINDGSIETPAEDAVTYLSRHGVAATVRGRHVLMDDAATVLLREIGTLDPDYLVMGGFGHSRMREALFGGVTRSMLSECSIPILLAH